MFQNNGLRIISALSYGVGEPEGIPYGADARIASRRTTASSVKRTLWRFAVVFLTVLLGWFGVVDVIIYKMNF